MNRIAEIVLLAVVCYLVFFGSLHRHTYINTEALRAVVVEEMLDRDGLTMPTVHEAPYLKKPPLYAWTTTLLARAVGRFDEQIARIPSAVAGTLFVLLVYALGERWFGCGAGLPAAVFALINPTVTDYSVRAELDMPFSLFCTANLALTLTALQARGARANLLWLAAYAAALAGSMWKGPHVLIFMWLTILAYSWFARERRFFKAPGQWLGLGATLGVLIWWARALGDFAGSSTVSRAAGVELFARLVPYKWDHFASMLTFPFMLLVITLPAAVFALLLLAPEVRSLGGLRADADGGAAHWRRKLGAGWAALKSQPVTCGLLAWLAPNLLFMLWAPAKAPRYSIPLFAPIFLLGGWVALLFDAAGPGVAAAIHARRIWRAVAGILGAAGALSLARLVAGLTGADWGLGASGRWQPWLVLAIGGLLPLAVEIARAEACTLRARLVLLLLALLAVQPLLHEVWWPLREAADSQTAPAVRIAELLPEGSKMFVVGRHEFPDTQIYARRTFRFVDSIDEALKLSGRSPAYALAREDELAEHTRGAVADFAVVYEFERAGRRCVIMEITPRAWTE